MVIKNRLPDCGAVIISVRSPLTESDFLSDSPSQPVFNAPFVAIALTASVPILYWVQTRVAAIDPIVIQLLAFQPSGLILGGWWPGVVTSMFLHAGWAHALFNMTGALAFAPPVARAMKGASGAAGFLLFYMVCGVLAALGYAVLHLNQEGWLVGASGAVFGLIGAALRLLRVKEGRLRRLTDRRFFVPAAVLMVVNAATGLTGLLPGASGLQVAWEAHAAGFVAGAVLIGPWLKIFGARPTAFDSAADLRDPSI
jgi:membrane associated rhomboid family serine protease